MNKVVIYCHGYASSANSDKLQMLKDAGLDAYSFDADIDPDVAYQYITDQVDMLLIDRLHEDIELVFVGTSLGGWTATRLAETYGAGAVIINPCMSPKFSLARYGVPQEILDKYEDASISKNNVYFFARHDDVIDHTMSVARCHAVGAPYTIVDGADHRFQKDFSLVIKFLTQAK